MNRRDLLAALGASSIAAGVSSLPAIAAPLDPRTAFAQDIETLLAVAPENPRFAISALGKIAAMGREHGILTEDTRFNVWTTRFRDTREDTFVYAVSISHSSDPTGLYEQTVRFWTCSAEAIHRLAPGFEGAPDDIMEVLRHLEGERPDLTVYVERIEPLAA